MRAIPFLFSLLLFASLAAHDDFSTEWSSEAIAPSAIHNGSVNVMTGRYVEHVRDIRVRGPFLLELIRSHLGPDNRNEGQQVIGWTGGNCYLSCFDNGPYQNETGQFQEDEYTSVAVTEFSGSRVAYRREGDGLPRWEPDLGYGWSNLAWGEISARTNPKNRLVARDGSSTFLLTKGNGDQLRFASTQPIGPDCFRTRGLKRYSLQEIERANGQRLKVRYSDIADGYCDRARPKEIAVESCSGQKLGWLQFDYTKKDGYLVKASDGQWVNFSIDDQHRLTKVETPGRPPIQYEHNTSTHSHYSRVKGLHRLTRRTEGENFLRNEYYEVGRNCVGGICFKLKSADGGRVEHPAINCVKEQFAPVGSNGEEVSIARYFYNFHPYKNSWPGGGGGHTDAYDAEDNRTTYFFANGYRITSVERCQGRNTQVVREGYVYRGEWNRDGRYLKESAELYGKIYFDANDQPIAAMTLDYDAYGNVICETLWGNLTGHCTIPLVLNEAGLPVDNGVDHFSREFEYTRCELEGGGARNLPLLERSGNQIARYTYWGETDRPESITLYDRNELIERHLFLYDPNGFLVEHVEEQGSRPLRITRIEPTATGLPRRVEELYVENGVEQLIGATEREYGLYNLVIAESVFDRDNQLRYTLTTEYDDGGRPVRLTNPMGVESSFGYDQYGRLSTELGPRPGYHVCHQYDKANRRTQTRVLGPNGEEFSYGYRYNRLSHLVEEINHLGQATQYTYDALGRTTSNSRPFIQFGYDLFGNCTRIENALGEVEEHRYTVRHQRAESAYPDGTIERWEYDLEGRLARTVSPEGVITDFIYDGVGRLLSEVERGADGTPGQELYLRWDGDLVIYTRDGLGVETHYDYDGAGRLIQVRCGEQLTEIVYDALGREERCIVWFGDASSDHVDTVWEHDLCGRTIEERVEDGQGKVWSRINYRYDEIGNVVAITTYGDGGTSCTQTVAYDALNRPVVETDPLGNSTCYEYSKTLDREGNWVEQIRVMDALKNTDELTYDPLGNLSSLERWDESGMTCRRVDYLHDPLGQKTEERHTVLLEGKRLETQAIRWEYGPCGRINAVHEELGKTTRFQYDASGRRSEKELPSGRRIAYQYDGLNRLSEESGSDYRYRYRYDRNDQLLSAEDETGATTLRSYGKYGQLLSEQLANGLTLSFQYDRAGRRLKTLLPDSSSIDYEHDPIGVSRVSRENYSRAILERDLSGRPTLEGSEPDGMRWAYEWDKCGRLVNSVDRDRQVRMAYDALGRVVGIEGEDAAGAFSSTYTYDPLSQLVKEKGLWTNSFQCDSIGNQRLVDEVPQQFDALNRIGPSDANGCMTQVFEAACQYDSRSRLVSVHPWKYTYDAFDRRVAEECLTGERYTYLYDGEVEIGRCSSSQSPSQLRLMLQSGARPRTVAVEIEGDLFSAVTSHRGDIVALLDGAGQTVETMRYSAYGQIDHFGEALSPWAISGKRFDATGFTYFGLRYYSPPLMRWLSPDPAGFTDGPNLYCYCWNNPLTFMDWLGMESEEATGWEWEWYKLPDMVDQICWGEDEICDILAHREALAGTLQGLVDYVVESVTDAILIASHVGSTELNLEDRNEFRESVDYEVQRGVEWVDSSLTAMMGDYHSDALFQRYRRKARSSAGFYSLIVPGVFATKGALRLGRKAFVAPVRAARASRMSGRVGQTGARRITGSSKTVGSVKRPKLTWPNTAEQMDEFLKMQGTRIPDTSITPGRGKVEWRPNAGTRIIFEQHPYHMNAPDWHKGPHFHLDTAGIKPHQRYLPGESIPGY
jgi:RHS repeat-associated protein